MAILISWSYPLDCFPHYCWYVFKKLKMHFCHRNSVKNAPYLRISKYIIFYLNIFLSKSHLKIWLFLKRKFDEDASQQQRWLINENESFFDFLIESFFSSYWNVIFIGSKKKRTLLNFGLHSRGKYFYRKVILGI